jgi:hypothetical protein
LGLFTKRAQSELEGAAFIVDKMSETASCLKSRHRETPTGKNSHNPLQFIFILVSLPKHSVFQDTNPIALFQPALALQTEEHTTKTMSM